MNVKEFLDTIQPGEQFTLTSLHEKSSSFMGVTLTAKTGITPLPESWALQERYMEFATPDGTTWGIYESAEFHRETDFIIVSRVAEPAEASGVDEDFFPGQVVKHFYTVEGSHPRGYGVVTDKRCSMGCGYLVVFLNSTIVDAQCTNSLTSWGSNLEHFDNF